MGAERELVGSALTGQLSNSSLLFRVRGRGWFVLIDLKWILHGGPSFGVLRWLLASQLGFF